MHSKGIVCKVSKSFVLAATGFLVIFTWYLVSEVKMKNPRLINEAIVFAGALWVYIFTLIHRFKVEVFEGIFRYRNVFSTYEVQFKDVESFSGAVAKTTLKQKSRFELKMKSGTTPKRHWFATMLLSADARASLVRQLIAAGAKEMD